MSVLALAAALSTATLDAPAKGHAFVVATTLRTSILYTSADALGCTEDGCPRRVYVRFADRPEVPYPADVLDKQHVATPLSIVALKVVRGELAVLPIAAHVESGDAVSLAGCTRDSNASAYVASSSASAAQIRQTIIATSNTAGCPVVTPGGVVGIVEGNQPSAEIPVSPGPAGLSSFLASVEARQLGGQDPVQAQAALIAGRLSDFIAPTYDEAAYSLCRRADGGDAQAAYGCALAFFSGTGAPIDYERALQYGRKSARSGNSAAAKMIADREQETADRHRSFEATAVRAQAGDAAAMQLLAGDYGTGYGTEQDPALADFWRGKVSGLAPATPPPASTPVPPSPATALVRARALAAQRFPDYDGASHAYLVAAQSGDQAAAIEAAKYIVHNYNTLNADEPEQLLQLMLLAAKGHYWLADDWIARFYMSSPGDKTRQWQVTELTDAQEPAKAHDPEAEAFLAEAYSGAPVLSLTTDCEKAIFWSRRAIADGAEKPGVSLMFGSGHIVIQGPCVATPGGLDFLHRIADRDDSVAQYVLGHLYETGTAVPKDLDAAAAWYRRAAKLGNPDARQRLIDLGLPE